LLLDKGLTYVKLKIILQLITNFMDKLIGLKEFRENVEFYTKKINQGQSFIVLKKSKPIFKLSPVYEEETWETIIDFTNIKKGGVPIQDIVKAISNEQTPKSNRKTTKGA
jgi:antitoxin (DNA-binding transcriptional repressor) of toxin-antitoxin stability system